MDYDRLRELQEKFDENPRRYFAPLANEYRKGGQVKRAIEICRAHLAQMPGHMSGQIVYGQALFEAGEWEEARTVFERALALDPENLIALRSLGDMSLQAGNTVEARSWYARLLDADSKDTAVIALVSEIDASSDAAASPAPEEIPGVDPGRGDQQISAVAEEAAPSPESAPVEAPSSAPAVAPEPAGLERHYPLEAPGLSSGIVAAEDQAGVIPAEELVGAEGLRGTEPEVAEQFGAEGLRGKPPTMPLAGATASRSDDPVALDTDAKASRSDDEEALATWTPPPPVSVHERTDARNEDRTGPIPAPEPFVNETMAQLYLQQGYNQLALKVYRQLSASRPHDQALKDRIAEIEAADAASHPAEAPAPRRREPPIGRPAGPAVTAPSSRAEPEGRSIAARQPSIREFFATLGRRSPPRAPGSPAMRSGNNMPSDIAPSLGNPAPVASLDTVFAGATVSPSDARAASRLAGAFSGATGGTRTPPTPPMPTPRVNPRVPQAQESEEDVAKFRAWLDGLTRE